jgi:hypothetical protein
MTHIPKIIIKCIDPENQRFGECGDWFYDADEDILTIFISKMPDWKSELAIAIHEFVEATMCLDKDIDQTDIDYFDKKFSMEHNEGEAGNDKDAPYHVPHISATFVEQEVCSQLKLPWETHSQNISEA